MSLDTIAALATPPGRGALATLRVSGPRAIFICDSLFRGQRRLASLVEGRAVTGWMTAGGDDLDEVVITLFRAPRSYTGDDLVEISCHGGPAAGYILEALVQAGARPAEPGEFTKRAFLNGRIDLSQAEAVAAVITARGRAAHRAALRILKGQLRERLEPVYSELLSLLARVEAHIEFPDDLEEANPRIREGYLDSDLGLAPNAGPPTAKEVSDLRDTLSDIVAQSGRSDLLSSGLRCVLSGPVNVGKSSLYNRLLERDRAIVTSEPGTTRDVLEGTLEVAGIPVTLVDTAGLREPTSRPEAEGTRRSVMERQGADLILEVRDASQPADVQDPIHQEMLSEGAEAGQKHLILLNKVDLGMHPSWEHLMSVSNNSTYGAVLCAERGGGGTRSEAQADDLWASHASRVLQEVSVPVLVVSALDGTGMEALREEIGRYLRETPGEEILLNLRQRMALRNAIDNLSSASRSLQHGDLPELVSLELSEAAREVGGILGRDPSDELLDAIFSQFCIGK